MTLTKFLICMAIIWISVMSAIFLIDYAFGSAIEDKGSLLNERLLERAEEWNRQKAINETFHVAEKFMCFNDKETANKFLEKLETYGITDYNVTIPCPELDLKTIPKDESNK